MSDDQVATPMDDVIRQIVKEELIKRLRANAEDQRRIVREEIAAVMKRMRVELLPYRDRGGCCE